MCRRTPGTIHTSTARPASTGPTTSTRWAPTRRRAARARTPTSPAGAAEPAGAGRAAGGPVARAASRGYVAWFGRPTCGRPATTSVGRMRFMLGRTNSGLARLATSAAVVVGSLGLQAATADAAGPFTVANPYAYGLGDDQIAINKLIAFGDSYSSLNRRAFPNWVEQFEAEANTNGPKEIKSVSDLAKSGATAGTYPGDNNNF